MITDPADIRYFSLLSLIGRCELQIDTGLRWRNSNVQIAKRVWGTHSRTVKGTLVELRAIQMQMLERRERENATRAYYLQEAD
jgi:hypothetical protein